MMTDTADIIARVEAQRTLPGYRPGYAEGIRDAHTAVVVEFGKAVQAGNIDEAETLFRAACAIFALRDAKAMAQKLRVVVDNGP